MLPEPSDCLVTTPPSDGLSNDGSGQCSHVFCRGCLVQWLSNRPSKTCPTCNHDLSYGGGRRSSGASQSYHRGSMQIGETTVTVLPLQQAQPLAHRLLKGICVKCPLSKHVNCKWRGDYADLQSHLLSPTAHKVSDATTAAKASAAAAAAEVPPSSTADTEPMEVEPTNNDNSSSTQGLASESETETANVDAQLQLALKTATAMKEEANGKFEARRYGDASSLYTKGISVLEEFIDSSSPETIDQPIKNECFQLLSVLYSNRAASQLSLGKNEECIDDCRYIISRLSTRIVEGGGSDTNSKVYLRACRAAIQLGDLVQASAFAARGLQTLDDNPAGPSGTGKKKIIMKELDNVHEMQRILSQAQESMKNHRYAEAKSFYSQLLMAAPSALPFLLGAARSDLGLGLTDQSLRLTKQILQKHPKSSEACWCRGLTLFLMNEPQHGLKLVQEALRLDPDAANIRKSYKSLKKIKEWMDEAKQQMFRRQFKDVVELLTKCIDECTSMSCLPPKSPLFATLHTDRAEAYLRLKDYNNVLRDCAKVVYVQEGHIPAWLIRIQAYHGLDDHEIAMEEIQQLLQRFEHDERLRKAYEKADFLIRKKKRVDYYELFGISSIASVMEIKKAYKKKSMEYHPDRIPPSASEKEKREAQRNFQLLGEGLEILCDDFQRKLYDEGYDPAAIRERVEAANHAAKNHRNGRYAHGHGGGHYHH